jgi:hypothetical protein
VAAGQLGLTGGAQPIFFPPNPRKTSIQLLLEAQQHKKYAQTTPLDDGVSSLFKFEVIYFYDLRIKNLPLFWRIVNLIWFLNI